MTAFRMLGSSYMKRKTKTLFGGIKKVSTGETKFNTPMYRCEIPGKVGVKKNQRRLAWVRGKPFSFPSVKYKTWENLALPYVLDARKGTLLCDLEARFEFHFKNKQAEIDIDNCLGGPLDLLQRAGVVKNDKQIVSVNAKKYFGGEEKTIIELRQAI